MAARRNWTEQENAQLIRMHGKYSRGEIAAVLGRSCGSIAKRVDYLRSKTFFLPLSVLFLIYVVVARLIQE